jgi:aromatic ring-opening dioxygenase catalytic subunit (LigB family)
MMPVIFLGHGNPMNAVSKNAYTEAWTALGKSVQRPKAVTAGNDASLIDYDKLGPDASLSIPTPDHYLPLLYVLGARRPGEQVTFPVEGVDGGSISMLAVQVG